MIEGVTIRRTFSSLLGGCLFLTEYTNKIRVQPVKQLIFKLDSFKF